MQRRIVPGEMTLEEAARPSVRQALAVLLAAALSLSLMGVSASQARADEASGSTIEPLVYEDVYGLVADEYALICTENDNGGELSGKTIHRFAVIDSLGKALISYDMADIATGTPDERAKKVAAEFAKVRNSLTRATGARPIEKTVEGGKEFGFVTNNGREVMVSRYSECAKGTGDIAFAGLDTTSRTVDAYGVDGALLASIPVPADVADPSFAYSAISNGTVRLNGDYYWQIGTTPAFTQGTPPVTWQDSRFDLADGGSVVIRRTDDGSDTYGRMYSCITPLATFTVDAREVAPDGSHLVHTSTFNPVISGVGIVFFSTSLGWRDGTSSRVKAYALDGTRLSGFDDTVFISPLTDGACFCNDADGTYSVRDATGNVLTTLDEYGGYSFKAAQDVIIGSNKAENRCIIIRYDSALVVLASLDVGSSVPEGYTLESCSLVRSNISGKNCITLGVAKIPDPNAPTGGLVATGTGDPFFTLGLGGQSGTAYAVLGDDWQPDASLSQASKDALLHAGYGMTVTDGHAVYPISVRDAAALGLVAADAANQYVLVDADLSRATIGAYSVFAQSTPQVNGCQRVPSYVNATDHRITLVEDANGKIGAVNATGGLVIPCAYEDCYALEDMPFALLKKDGAWVSSEALLQEGRTVRSSDDSVVKGRVTVDTEDGLLPDELKDASLSIKEVAPSLVEKVEQLLADIIGTKGSIPHVFDINFVDPDNKAIPWNDATRPLTVSIDLTDAMRRALESCDLKVYHIDDSDTSAAATDAMDTTSDSDTLSFKTTHFSTYAVAAVPRSSDGSNGSDSSSGDDPTHQAGLSGDTTGNIKAVGASTAGSGSDSALVKTGDVALVLALLIAVAAVTAGIFYLRLRGRAKRK